MWTNKISCSEVPEEVNSSTTKVKLFIDELIAPRFGNKQKPKNGAVDVTFRSQGFFMAACIVDKEGNKTDWCYNVKKLPSKIDTKKSSWKVDSGMVVITLVKEREMSWEAMLRNGLEQDSDGSDEEVAYVRPVLYTNRNSFTTGARD